MSNQQVRIAEFPHDGRSWRLDWIDGVVPTGDPAQEFLIWVVLHPFDNYRNVPHSTYLSSTKDVVLKDRVRRKVGVGLLPVLKLGSIWLNGVLQGYSAGKEETYSVDVNPENVSIEALADRAGDGYVLPAPAHRVSHNAGAINLVVKRAMTQDGKPGELVIPAFEIIRFYYACSTRLSHVVFGGVLQLGLQSIVKTEVLKRDIQSGAAYLQLRKRFHDPDAWVIGRILYSEKAFWGATRVYSTIYKDFRNHGPKFPESNFPFVGPTNLRVRGKPVLGADGIWRFWVFSIESCSGAFPFTDLYVYRDNPGKKKPPENEDPTQWPIKYPEVGQEDLPEFKSTQPIILKVKPLLVRVAPAVFTATLGKRLIQLVQELKTRSGGKWRTFEPVHLRNLSTGSGAGGTSDGGGLLSPGPSSPPSGGPGPFEELLQELEKEPGILASRRAPVPGLTAAMPPDPLKTNRQWAYMDTNFSALRRVYLGDLQVDGRWFLLIDFDRKNKDSKYTLPVFWSESFEQLSDLNVHTILRLITEFRGVWRSLGPKLLPAIRLRPFKHTWREVGSAVSRIVGLCRGA